MSGNLNYPDYNNGFGGYGGYQPPPASPASSAGGMLTTAGGGMSMVPGLQVAGAATSLAGLGLSAYGAYKQNKAIEEQNRLAREIFDEERERSIEKDAFNRESELLNRDLGYGNYAKNEEDHIMSGFGNYASRVGL